jgi:hypothetical protein
MVLLTCVCADHADCLERFGIVSQLLENQRVAAREVLVFDKVTLRQHDLVVCMRKIDLFKILRML